MFSEKKITIFILTVIILLVAIYTFKVVYKNKYDINESTKNIFADSVNGEIYYTDIHGNQVSLEKYLGKILLVTSWASWSPFSTNDLANLSDLANEYDQDQVIFLAINRKESREHAERYMDTIPNLSPKIILVLDTRDNFYTSINGYAMPETVMYDKKGNIVEHIHGTLNKDQLKEKINNLLSE